MTRPTPEPPLVQDLSDPHQHAAVPALRQVRDALDGLAHRGLVLLERVGAHVGLPSRSAKGSPAGPNLTARAAHLVLSCARRARSHLHAAAERAGPDGPVLALWGFSIGFGALAAALLFARPGWCP